MEDMTMPENPEISVSAHGAVPHEALETGAERMLGLVKVAGAPVLHIRFRLTHLPHRSIERPAVAQAVFDVDGRPVRAQVSAGTFAEAIELLDERMREQLDSHADREQTTREQRRRREPGEWRHGDEALALVPGTALPEVDRQIVRHKAFGVAVVDIDEAAYDMDSQDYRFHLFTNAANGCDSIIYHRTDGGLGLSQIGEGDPGVTDASWAQAELDPTPVPRLSTQEAQEALELSGSTFVFFQNAESGRGNVLYRRYDRAYGLIEPAEVPATRPSRAGS
jgi:Sigma 54 modulation/S30EA ribosomal protein C terminus